MASRAGAPEVSGAKHDAIHAALAAIFGTTSPLLKHVAALAAPGRRNHRPPGVERHWMEEELVLMVQGRLDNPARDGEPGGGLVRHLRRLLRSAAS